jgi:ATP-dependent RNA helicase DDX27
MLEEQFSEQLYEIIEQCSKKRQTMLFSATMTDEVFVLVLQHTLILSLG